MSLNIKFINASAGSGKTHELMERMAEMVCPAKQEGKPAPTSIPAEKILATTFTEKAAAELRSRVREKLLDGGHIQEAQGVFGGLIGTVNGICGRLVEEYAFELGLPPGLQVIPSGDGESEDFAEIVFARAAESVFAQYEEDIRSLAERLDLMPESSGKRRTSWKDMARKLADGLRYNDIKPGSEAFEKSRELSLEQARTIFPATDREAIKDATDAIQLERSNLEKVIGHPADVNYNSWFVQCAEALLDFVDHPSWLFLYDFRNEWLDKGKVKQAAKAQKVSMRAEAVAVHQLIEDLSRSGTGIIPDNFMASVELREDVEKMIRLLFEIAPKCMEEYQKYKAEFGLFDFVDQETLALKLFREHGKGAFGKAFKERVSAIMVDEFQDTSPLQLALFLEMHKLVPNVTFVGDPKQAIYEFRGTDPTLMMSVAKKVKEDSPDLVKSLPNSWRSQKQLVDFVNAVFVPTFAGIGMSKDDVALTLPPKRVEDPAWQGGEFEAWMLEGVNSTNCPAAIAESVVKFIRREPSRQNHLKDIAILCRSNWALGNLAAALSERAVPVSFGAGVLKDQLECQLAMAAYRYAINRYDTAALATLAAHLMDPKNWLKTMAANKGRLSQLWEDDPRIVALGRVDDRTAGEMLDHAIAAVGLDAFVSKMPDGDRRLRNLTALRELCVRYMQESSFGGYPATPVGFVSYVQDSKGKCASAEGGDCVQLLTYHRAKGLEWPTVVLTELDSEPPASAFSQTVVSEGLFNVEEPLAGRFLRVVPNPLGNKLANARGEKQKKPILDYLHVSAGCKALDEAEEGHGKLEMQRLMYVGMTRAINRLVFALQSSGGNTQCQWLDLLGGDTVRLAWESADFNMDLGGKSFPVKVFKHDKSDPTLKLDLARQGFEDGFGRVDVRHDRAYLPPSGEEGTEVPVRLLNPDPVPCVHRVVVMGKGREIERERGPLGNAMHNYYAVAVPKGVSNRDLAECLLKRWGVEGIVSAADLVESGESLRKYIVGRWPDAEILTEVPMTLVNEHGQRYQGYIDMLVKVGNDYVLIDHKTTSNHSYEAVAQQYAGQMAVYKRAIEKATNAKVLMTVLHLPVCGVCLECVDVWER